MPDGSTKIVVQPFAEPVPEGANEPNRFVVSRVIEKSTLSLYGPPTGYLAPAVLPGAPVRTDIPPASGASSPVPAYKH